jgi:uncharacterized protein
MFHVLTLTYLRPLDVVDQARPDNVAWIKREIEAGRLILAGRQESEQGGILITGDISSADAEELMADDPYQLTGLVRYERSSFNGSLRAPGL